MNIQRYKLPVIIAASLHGALFLSTPDPLIKPPLIAKPADLPPRPTEVIEVAQDIQDTSADVTPASGGPAAPTLPDTVIALPDKTAFVIPVVEHPHTDRVATSLKDIGNGGPDTGGVINMGGGPFIPATGLDRQPRATAQMSPDYPSSMRQQGIAGSVIVEFDVNREGTVIRAEVVHYTRREFEEPALRAVRKWHFEPGKRQGHAVPFRMTVPIEFGLETN